MITYRLVFDCDNKVKLRIFKGALILAEIGAETIEYRSGSIYYFATSSGASVDIDGIRIDETSSFWDIHYYNDFVGAFVKGEEHYIELENIIITILEDKDITITLRDD